ncbi:MAG TPA: hypothetical protein V6D04_04260 [Candidatus Obscuribacterales bacterium]
MQPGIESSLNVFADVACSSTDTHKSGYGFVAGCGAKTRLPI